METPLRVGTDAEVERRAGEAHRVLREYWSRGEWEEFSPEEFYVTWGGLFAYARALLLCQLTCHRWNDSYYNLYGSPGGNRYCERCGRLEILRGRVDF